MATAPTIPPARPRATSARRSGSTWLPALGAGLAALAVYAAMGQAVFYKIDGQGLVFRLEHGDIAHPYNLGYMPMAWAVHALLGPWGSSAYSSAVALSALGGAVAVALGVVVFAATGLHGRRLAAATAALGLCPPVFFFATVVEHHAPFLPFAVACYGLTAWLARSPSALGAVGLGLATHVAFLVHGTGNLLPALLLPTFLAWRWRAGTRRRDLVLASIAGAVHVGLYVVLLPVELPAIAAEGAVGLFGQAGSPTPQLADVPAMAWREWLWPYLPWSVVALVALGSPRLRLEAAAALLGVVPFVGVCLLLLVDEPEFGAYLVALSVPMARLSAVLLPCWGAALAAALSAVLAVHAVRVHDDPAVQREWAAGLRAELAVRPGRLILGGMREIGFALAELPDREFHDIGAIAYGAGPADREEELLRQFDLLVEICRAEGRTLLLSDGAMAELAGSAAPFGPRLAAHVRSRHELRRVERRGFGGWRID